MQSVEPSRELSPIQKILVGILEYPKPYYSYGPISAAVKVIIKPIIEEYYRSYPTEGPVWEFCGVDLTVLTTILARRPEMMVMITKQALLGCSFSQRILKEVSRVPS